MTNDTTGTPIALTIKQACELTQIGESRMRALINSYQIPHFRPSPNVIRIPRDLLEQWVIDQATRHTEEGRLQLEARMRPTLARRRRAWA